MLEITPYGDTWYEACPVCESDRIEPIWKVPFTRLEEPVSICGKTVQYAPMYGSVKVYEYSCCYNCESLFQNPYLARRKDAYASPDNKGAWIKIRRALNRKDPSWRGYQSRYRKYIGAYFPPGAKSLVDAACGGGQLLQLAQQDKRVAFERLVGLEISPIAVQNLRDNRIEAHRYDIDSKEPPEGIDPGSIDFVIFSEAFEHMEFPLRALRNLTTLLRPGGRMFFSAQRTDATLPLRPGENHSITEKGLDMILERLSLRALEKGPGPGKWHVVVEKLQP